MKFAIPVINGLLSSHWGQTSEFMIIEVNNSKQVVGKETMVVPTHDCHGTPLALAKKGVNVVLAGGMGMGPRSVFEGNGVEVVLGVSESDPEKAVIQYLEHQLEIGDNVCHHDDEANRGHGEWHQQHHGDNN
ncbi:MAG TPA: ATPase [Dehalococcoidia bacterium]|jgi:predicted Fe-Mo cluster-binding NifX family protein|nr:ATPase [Dehalococcoidia bacterium]HAS27736.1 ATPase [Dehalococcoidia bacterium]